jgi:hypothetical protein
MKKIKNLDELEQKNQKGKIKRKGKKLRKNRSFIDECECVETVNKLLIRKEKKE